ncbi:MAG TPA: YqcC family protein, partial [Minicystis sp.]|nr:YqcC family protein [Minicystis sp.]
MAPVDCNEVRARLDAVVAAMKQSGAWDVARPEEAAFVDMGAFGTKTMAFEQWLRWVFVPSIEARLGAGGPWPNESHVAAQAAREHGFGGSDAVGALVGPLSAFDALFTPPPP